MAPYEVPKCKESCKCQPEQIMDSNPMPLRPKQRYQRYKILPYLKILAGYMAQSSPLELRQSYTEGWMLKSSAERGLCCSNVALMVLNKLRANGSA